MGYTTDFDGRFELNKPLTVPDANALKEWAGERHEGVNIPGIWCQWVPTHDGVGIEWDGMEKFYGYVEWLEYIIEHFLGPKGYVLNGVVRYQGEDIEDVGRIEVKDNVVTQTKLDATGVVECPDCGHKFKPGE